MLRIFYNFRFRLTATIFLFAVTATSVGLIYYYRISSRQIWGQMTSRVKDFGKIGATMLSRADKDFLEKLDRNLNAPNPGGETLPIESKGTPLIALADSEKTAIVRKNEFQYIVQKLRRLRYASRKRPIPDDTLPAAGSKDSDPPQIHRTWIAGIEMHRHTPHFLRVLCADEFEVIDRNNNQKIDPDEAIYQIGDIFNGRGQSGIDAAMNGEATVSNGYHTENTGVYISGYTPIRNAKGKIIALLVVDFSAATEFDALFDLKITGYYIILSVFLFSILAAAAISRILLEPLEEMQRAAIRISRRDFSVRVETRQTDELADLAFALNLMARELGDYSINIERRIAFRTREISGILEALEQGLFTVDRLGIIQNEYSNATLKIFGTTEIAQRIFSTLFPDPKLQSSVDKFLEVYFSGSNITPQMLEKANPIRKVQYLNAEGKLRHLRFDFRPLRDEGDDLITRLLVIVADDTQEVQLQNTLSLAEADKRSEFDILINLMQIPPAILDQFMVQQREFLHLGKTMIGRFESVKKPEFESFSTHVHALKGNAAQLGFSQLAELLHQFEDLLLGVIRAPGERLRVLRVEFSHFINGAENVILGRDKLVTRIRALVGAPDNDPETRLRALANFWRLQIEQKAAQAEVPVLVVTDLAPGCEESMHVLHNVLVQLLRNTFAHGIETSAERALRGKPPELKIEIRARQDTTRVMATYSEDGKGFAFLREGDTVALAELSQKGLTAVNNSVTIEAGRGWGLDYIIATVENLEGQVHVSLNNGVTSTTIELPR
jgi:HPt (histidine-containing phosphotransfer) domain-containing protein/HAMP domain-containing protein